MRCIWRREPTDVHHSQAYHLVHNARYVDKDFLRIVNNQQRCVWRRLRCQVWSVWRNRMDRRYVLRVRKHLLRDEPVLLSVSLSQDVGSEAPRVNFQHLKEPVYR